MAVAAKRGRGRPPGSGKRPMSEAQREALEKAQAARRSKTVEPGRETGPAQQPGFMDPAPPPGERQPDAKPVVTLSISDEIKATFGGAHFLAAWATGIEQLAVSDDEASAVSGKFCRMCEAWGIDLSGAAGGRILATINFAVVFGSIELSKLAVLRQVMAMRQAEMKARADQAEREAAGAIVPGAEGPAPGVQSVDVGPGGMTDRPFDLAAE